MEIAIAQPNFRIGDFEGNAGKVLALAEESRALGARLLLLPRRSLGGEPAGALLAHPEFHARSEEALERLRREAPPELAIVLGVQGREGRDRSVVLAGGEVVADGEEAIVFEHEGLPLGILPFSLEPEALDAGLGALRAKGAKLVLLPGGLPFFVGGHRWWDALLSALARRHGIPLACSQPVGGNDSLVFDGDSAAYASAGETIAAARRFQEDTVRLQIEPSIDEGDLAISLPARPSTPLTLMGGDTAEVVEALCLGIRDYVRKSGFEKVILGLSGGIDSALVAVLAARAMGPERVVAVAMPSRYTSAMSIEDAEALSAAQGIELKVVPIEPVVQALSNSLGQALGGPPSGLAAENLQARARGVLLMALSNQEGALVLNSGNKSELAVGYSTLYGDMVGALGVLGDLPKTWVYEVARHLNLQGAGIPPRILSRPPSAELRPDQTDQDSLPPYDRLDRVLHRSLVEGWGLERMREAHEDEEAARKTLSLLLGSEYKRRQAVPPIRVTLDGLHERVYPIAHGFRLD